MWARIENGTVVELTGNSPDGRFHPSLEWVECPDNVVPGWVYSETGFAAPEPPDRDIAAERFKRETANMLYDGHEFFMDREARTTLAQTIDRIRRGKMTEELFKTVTGWYLLTVNNIDAIEDAGIAHIRAAFAWERAQQEV